MDIIGRLFNNENHRQSLSRILEETREVISILYNLETEFGISIIDGLSDQLRSMIIGGVFSSLSINIGLGKGHFIKLTPDESKFTLHTDIFRDLCSYLEAESIKNIHFFEGLMTTILKILIFLFSLKAYLSAAQSIEDDMLDFVNFQTDTKVKQMNLKLQRRLTEDIKNRVEILLRQINSLLLIVKRFITDSTRRSRPISSLYPES